MGWPRKNDGGRLYREKDGGYLLMWVEPENQRYGIYSAVANVHPGPGPSLASTNVGCHYLARTWPTRVQWDELPATWRRELRRWFKGRPAAIRGFWRVGCQPATR